jgi:DNA-binding protein YbaB
VQAITVTLAGNETCSRLSIDHVFFE